MKLADFNPAILFFILWGLLSWFTKKKKNQVKEKEQGGNSEIKPKANLFARLQELQEHLSEDLEILPKSSEYMEVEKEYPPENDEYVVEESEILTEEVEGVQESEVYVNEPNLQIPTTKPHNWLKQTLSIKSELRKIIILKEVLGEPRSLKPYSFDSYI